MDVRLVDFLKIYEVGKGEIFTHTTKITPCRRYNIPDECLSNFYNVYNDVIDTGGITGVTERPMEVMPLIVDIDLKCTIENGIKRYYKPKHTKKIIKAYHKIIQELSIEPTDKTFICCVLEKSSPVQFQGKCKDGIHLHFPYFYVEQSVQKGYIRDRIIDIVTNEKILEDLPLEESIDKVFDKNIPAVCWLMYGSRKETKAEAYKIKSCYNKDLELMQIKDVFKKRPNKEKSYTWNLPQFMSIRHNRELTPINTSLLKKKKPKKSELKLKHRNLDVILADLILAEQLLSMLNKERADDYHDWIEIGWILFNIGEGHQKALDQWITFSKLSEKFEEGVCEEQWSKMEMQHYTLASLKYLARYDAPNEFKSWRDSQINHILHQGISMTHNDIAKILHIMYENQFVCADVKNKIWYEFRGHRWVTSDQGIGLRKKISCELVNQYNSLIAAYSEKIAKIDQEDVKQMFNAKIALITKLIGKLKNGPFKSSVMNEAVEFFYDENFVKKMDENRFLLVCENGVYDARTFCFRSGRPDDNCTKSTNKYYIKFKRDDPRVKELLRILRLIYVDPKLYKFFRQSASDLILGGNRHKCFHIWTGDGDNGKSIIAELIEKVFGEYFYTPPTTLLTQKSSQADTATASLIPTKGARVVAVSETGNGDILNCGIMKKLTGGDPFYARGLFKDPVKIIPQFKLICHCNYKPDVNANDKASWNRIKVLPFESTFLKNNDKRLPKSPEEQLAKKLFPRDATLKDKLNDMAEVFLWWLIKEYEYWGDRELYEPPQVLDAINDYQKSNDFYMQFYDETIQQTDDNTDTVSVLQIYEIFKIWYKSSYPSMQTPNRKNFEESLKKKMKIPIKGIWRGFKLLEQEEENNNDNVEKLLSK